MDLGAVFYWLKGSYRKGRTSFFSEVHRERTRGKEHVLQQLKIWGLIRKDSSLWEWCSTGIGGQGRWGIPILGSCTSLTGHGPVRSHLALELTLLWARGWTGDFQKSLLTWIIQCLKVQAGCSSYSRATFYLVLPLQVQAALELLGQLELIDSAAVCASHDTPWKRKPALVPLVIPPWKVFLKQ